MANKKTKGNVCGIVSLCLGWLIPLVGLILGIIALGRGEDNKAIGIVGIILSILFWLFWIAILMGV